jgi:hypothetical protein
LALRKHHEASVFLLGLAAIVAGHDCPPIRVSLSAVGSGSTVQVSIKNNVGGDVKIVIDESFLDTEFGNNFEVICAGIQTP